MRVNKNIPKALSLITEMEVEFYDVDSMRIVWHGNYIKYFEAARCRLLDKLGYNYLDMEHDGFIWPVVDLKVKYIKPINFKQIILVEAAILEYENRLKVQYVIRDKLSDEKLTVGYSIQVAVDQKTNMMLYRSPQHVIDHMDKLKG
ncbi:acyl-CoA thioesterase [Thiotrichales bacterium 19S9-12]|nr:acyl-CoA thioesterase [Thiotrichales bacterium 19S9-11]MCF6810795.1 acyl-CoA thioesterase [Thiotrichales bacterium 19S9-12]